MFSDANCELIFQFVQNFDSVAPGPFCGKFRDELNDSDSEEEALAEVGWEVAQLVDHRKWHNAVITEL